jgi:ABC-type lipoprotein export system ATPase subunit
MPASLAGRSSFSRRHRHVGDQADRHGLRVVQLEHTLEESELTRLRLGTTRLVFQQVNLIPMLSAAQTSSSRLLRAV